MYSGVPQGSVLGPLAFVIFINDLDYEAGLITIINKFADDKKLGQRISSEDDKDNLQECLTRLTNWASMWCIEFNVKNVKFCMSVGIIRNLNTS